MDELVTKLQTGAKYYQREGVTFAVGDMVTQRKENLGLREENQYSTPEIGKPAIVLELLEGARNNMAGIFNRNNIIIGVYLHGRMVRFAVDAIHFEKYQSAE